jgi:hypothetical protein
MYRTIVIFAAALLAVPLVAAADTPAPSPARPQLHDSSTGGADEGWGTSASFNGQSVDLRDIGGGWGSETAFGPKDSAAGYGWRSGGSTAMVGYSDIDYGAPSYSRTLDLTHEVHDQSRSILGLTFVMRR